MEASLAQVVIQGGMAGIAVLALWILYKISSNHIEHHEAQVARFADLMEKDLVADREMAAANVKFAEAINRLTDRLGR